MKNLKKVLALVLSMALLISTFTVSFAAEATNLDEATKLNAMGLFNGTSGTEFVPELEGATNRIQALVIIGRMLGWSAADIKAAKDAYEFTDVPEGEFADLAQYAFENGITNGVGENTFGSEEPITSRMLYAWFYAALGYGKAADAYNNPALLATSGLVSIDKVTEITTGAISGNEKALIRDDLVGVMFDSLTWNASGNETTLVADLVAAGIVTAEAAAAAGVYTVPVVTLGVEKVEVLNAKQIKVSFNKAMDKASLVDVANYEIKDKGTATIVLTKTVGTPAVTTNATLTAADDAKSVIITLDLEATDKLTNSTTAKVIVKKTIIAADKSKMAADSETSVNVYDGVIPSATNVKAVGTNTLEVEFTEPVIDNGGIDTTLLASQFSVKSGTYTYVVQSAIADFDKKTVTLTTGTKLIEGPIVVGINVQGAAGSNAIEDFAGIKAFKGEINFNYAKDTSAPVVSIKSNTQNEVVLEFDRPVNASALTLFHSVNGVSDYSATASITGEKEVTFTFTNKMPEGTVKLFLVNSTVAGQEITDLFGNKLGDQVLYATVTIDNEGPTVAETKLNTNATFDITFSENVDMTLAKTTSFTVKSLATGKDVAFGVSDDTKKKVTLTFSPLLTDNTSYQVVVKTMKDLAGNIMTSEAVFELNVGDNNNPEVSSTKAPYAVNADGKIYITFSEPMNEAQMLDKSNYVVDADTTEAVTGFVALGSDDTVTKISDKAVLIDLKVAVNKPSVKLGAITDLAGKKLTSDTAMVTSVNTIAEATLNISSATLIAKNKVKLVFDKQLASFDNTEIDILQSDDTNPFTNDIQVQSVESMIVNADGVTEVVLVLDKEIQTDAKYLEGTPAVAGAVHFVTIATPANTKSIEGTVLAGAQADALADTLAPEVVMYDHDTNANTAKVARVVLDYTDGDGDNLVDKSETAKISIYFSEDMELLSMSTLSFKVDGFTVTGVALNTTASIVELTATANADNTTQTPTVTHVYDVTDANDIVYTAGNVWTATN